MTTVADQFHALSYESGAEPRRNMHWRVGIIDDCGAAPGCKKAVDDGRAENNTIEPMKWTNWTGAYRQRQRRRAASPAQIQ